MKPRIVPIFARAFVNLLLLVGLLFPGVPESASAQAPDTYTNGRVVPTYAWHTLYGGYVVDNATSMAKDSSGNIYITGSSHYNWPGLTPLHPFTITTTPLSRTSADNLFVAKFSSTGQLLWHTFYSGEGGTTQGRKILVDLAGNVYIIAHSNVNWDGLTAKIPLHGSPYYQEDGDTFQYANSDIVVLKLNSTGVYQWHTYYGSTKVDDVYTAAFDNNSNIVIAGTAIANWSGLTPANPFSGSFDFFTLRIDRQGGYLWHSFYGMQSGNGTINDMKIDAAGNMYLTGNASDLFTGFKPIRGLSAPDTFDILVMKLSNTGKLLWYTFYGKTNEIGYSYDDGRALLVSNGSLYITGKTGGSWQELKPLHESQETYNLFLLKLTDQGNFQWYTEYGPASGNSITLDRRGYLYIVGRAEDIRMNPENPPIGDGDILVMALGLQGQYVSHTYYGTKYTHFVGDGEDVGNASLLVDNALYLTGYSDTDWAGHTPLHAGFHDADVFLSKINMLEKPALGTIITLPFPNEEIGVEEYVTLIATVKAADYILSTGTVTFKDGDTVLGIASLWNGTAYLQISFSSGGKHSLTALYSGSRGFNPSQTSQATIINVIKAATSVALTIEKATMISYGQQNRLVATVDRLKPKSEQPTGTVTFKADDMVLGTVNLVSPYAVLNTTRIPAGNPNITAVYSGDNLYEGNFSSPTRISVNKADSSLSLQVPPIVGYGSELLTATVTNLNYPDALTDGVVTFLEGDQELGRFPLSGGKATLLSPAVGMGTHTITAKYDGSGNYNPAAPVTSTIEVGKGIPDILITTESTLPLYSGESSTIIVRVQGQAPGSIVATGTVTLIEGDKEIGTLPLVDGAAAFDSLNLAAGVHTFTAAYSGDTLYLRGTSTEQPVIVYENRLLIPYLRR